METTPEREASQWTQPLQASVAAFFVVSALVNTLIVLGFSDLYRHRFTLMYEQSQQVAADRIGPSADAAVTLSIVITIVFALIFLVLAALSYFRRAAWVFIVDMVVLFLAGVPSVVAGVINLVSPSNASLPQVFALTQLVLALVAISLLILMLGLSLRYGTWAQHPVRAPAAE
ncbi:MAG: hypothetical protein QOK05_2649 [Chloroflexota bacterium]|nr:hypothetical protein [Chloroflexota bacterium]